MEVEKMRVKNESDNVYFYRFNFPNVGWRAFYVEGKRYRACIAQLDHELPIMDMLINMCEPDSAIDMNTFINLLRSTMSNIGNQYCCKVYCRTVEMGRLIS